MLPRFPLPGRAVFRTLTAVAVGAALVGALAGCTDIAGVSPSTVALATSVAATDPPTVTTTTPFSITTTLTTAPPVVTAPPTAAAPDGLTPLIPGHNQLDARRINLVFAPYGWDDLGAFEEIARWYLGWDGHAALADAQGQPTDDPALAATGQLGLFGIEPFRSHRDSFNVWVTDLAPSWSGEWLYGPSWDPFSTLPNRSVIILARDEAQEGFQSYSGQDWKIFWPNAAATDDDPFANMVIAVWSWAPLSTILDVPHELGHALFSLTDEYIGRVESGAYPRGDIGPSCAASRATAEAWWGDLIGDYDPMIDIWIDEMTAAGFDWMVGNADSWRDQVRTAYVEGGCFGLEGSFRSAEDTMMGFNVPAFGLTNRRWMEEVLAQFGTLPQG